MVIPLETSLSFFGDGRCFVSTDEPALVRRCYAGIENHRDEVEIIAEPPENDGVLYFSCPVSFGRRAVRALFGPKQSAEQKAAAAAR